MALIGAASFFGGVSRLTVSLTVIMIEITNDVAFLLPIMVAIMVSKWVGDYITHPLYHSLLELKCIPFLESEPIVYNDQHQLLNLELFKARDVMKSPVVTISLQETIAHLAHVLLETTYGGFPVVKYCSETHCEVAFGLLTRTELCVILCHDKTRDFVSSTTAVGLLETPLITYEELSVDSFSNKAIVEILENYVSNVVYQDIYISLEPYVNRSAARIDEDFSLHRTYIVFRTLGLRHLTVVDAANRVVGIVTRKDLMGYNLEERLEQRKRRGYSLTGGILRLLPSEQSTAATAGQNTTADHMMAQFGSLPRSRTGSVGCQQPTPSQTDTVNGLEAMSDVRQHVVHQEADAADIQPIVTKVILSRSLCDFSKAARV